MREVTGTYCSSVQEELVKLKEDTPSLFGVGLLVQVRVKVAQLWKTGAEEIKRYHENSSNTPNSKFSFKYKYFKKISTAGLKLFLATFSLVISKEGKGRGIWQGAGEGERDRERERDREIHQTLPLRQLIPQL